MAAPVEEGVVATTVEEEGGGGRDGGRRGPWCRRKRGGETTGDVLSEVEKRGGERQIEGVGGRRGLDVKSMGLDNFFGSGSLVCVTRVYETRLP